MRRVRLPFAPELEVEFTDRVRAIEQVRELAERGTRYPLVVFGPEGCGKTAWLKQGVEVLRESEFSAIYSNPLRRDFVAEVGIRSIEERAREVLRSFLPGYELAKAVWRAVGFAREAIKLGRGRVAVVVDEAFQLTGARSAALFVKGLLELIEHPDGAYERVVAIAATSEGFSRREIGRHRWADLKPMWNMGRRGFEELYERIPGPKPPFEEVWRLTGGNPDALRRLYQAGWSADAVVGKLVVEREVAPGLVSRWRSWLEGAVEDPDTL